MSLSARLQPNNTLAVKSTAHNAFCRFLNEEGMSIEEALRLVEELPDGRGMAVVMDKFAIYLAFGDGTRGAKLATNTVNSYFGNVKLWLLGLYPAMRNLVQPELQVVGARLSKYCKKRSGGIVVKKAPPCRKEDLRALLTSVYKFGSLSSDYLDGLLLNWLWYLFGRSSDLCGVQTSSIAVYPGGALCIRFTRQKTADESGLTLFRDKTSLVTCPVNALAVALAMKTGKERLVFSQLPGGTLTSDEDNDLLSIPLRDLLDEQRAASVNGSKVPISARPLARVAGVASPAVHSYVNRLLVAIQKKIPAGYIREELSSHSFRRGGAQHGNGNSQLSPQWILDRGAWNMSATNKGFVYIMNTTREDQQVSRHLSDWSQQEDIMHIDLTCFDGVVLSKIRQLASVLYSGCDEIGTPVLDVLMATIVLHYPAIVRLQADESVGFVARVRQCLDFCDVTESEFLSWHGFLHARTDTPVRESKPHEPKERLTAAVPEQTSSRLEAMLVQLLEQNREQGERILRLEKLLETKAVDGLARDESNTPTTQRSHTSIRKAAKKCLRDAWVEWRSFQPPRWAPSSPLCRQERHEHKFAVAYMTLFLTEGYQLTPSSPTFASDVQHYGELAQSRLIHFLREGNISAASLGPIVKAMREIYSHGGLDEHINAYTKLLHEGRIVDHLPEAFQAAVILPRVKNGGKRRIV